MIHWWVMRAATATMMFTGVLTVWINAHNNNGGAAMSGVCLFLAGLVVRWTNE